MGLKYSSLQNQPAKLKINKHTHSFNSYSFSSSIAHSHMVPHKLKYHIEKAKCNSMGLKYSFLQKKPAKLKINKHTCTYQPVTTPNRYGMSAYPTSHYDVTDGAYNHTSKIFKMPRIISLCKLILVKLVEELCSTSALNLMIIKSACIHQRFSSVPIVISDGWQPVKTEESRAKAFD